MRHELALKLRDTLQAVFDLNEHDYYHVLIKQRERFATDEDWIVYLYANTNNSTFLFDLTVLAHGLESCTPSLRSSYDDIDIGIMKPLIRRAVKLI